MTGNRARASGSGDRIDEASDWFARMRGPDGETSRGAFDAWRSDPANAEAYARIEAVWAMAGSHPAAAARGLPPRGRWVPMAVAAAVVALAAAFGAIIAFRDRSPRLDEDIAYASPAGATRTVDLADGSRVTLGASSRIAVDLDGDERRVRLETGRARFAVAHDRSHPFVVLAAGRAVVARGTVFDVSLAGGMEVTLIEGAVDLESRAQGAAPRRLGRLRPGERASFLRPGQAPRIVVVDPRSGTGPMLAGDGMDLGDIVAAANRQGSPGIVLADPGLGALRVSGGFQPQRTRDLARTLAAALDLRAVTRSDGVIVLERTPLTPAAGGGEPEAAMRPPQ